ncbi:E3 ubiquitin-protein ligase KCMF1-like isoform X1 [Octopus vulgaris]|uniref:E3 ubiquitin-protein ligase KCMF1-like isoform X1 n=2 Tax=Octopus TaxID=6643 RepID=A0AA36BKM8_OCTVU|nr:E3 ubiquitin-protein ligase KCMF1 isoform X2 [Octopus sinensis]CAI9736165.1 E3 ubiquitin-protein ligase KCMF1-like isoform X1 [Octopus vulgaris]
MSRHEGVSCDSCLKGNFRGKRYKCLVCYDYDLCANCYEAGATTTRHTTDHPVQCILTKADFELYYGGEALPAEQAQSFTCPYCGKMGFTEATLQEHVTSEHADASTEVVCPICAALPGGDPNHVTDDFAAHLTLEHRTPREFEESSGMRHVRRIPHPARGVGSTRSRRANMHIPPGGSTLSGLSPNGRESMDPIAELLSQLSSVRSRAAAAQSVSSQLQQLEMQLQSTNRIDGVMTTTQSVNASSTGGLQSWSRFQSWLAPDHGQQLERLPRRQAEIPKPPAVTTTTTTPNSSTEPPSASSSNTSNSNSQFLLPRCMEFALSEGDQSILEMDHSLFVQEVLLSTLDDELQPLFLEKMIQLEIGSGVNPQEKAPNIGGGSGSSSGGRSGSDNSSGGTVSGESSSSSSSNDTSLQKSTVKSKATRQRPLESSLHNQPKGSGSSGNSNCSSGGNGSAGSCSSSGATSSGASCGSSNIAGGGTQNITVIKQMSASSNSASRSASGTSPISATSQSSSLTQANLVLLSGQGSNIGRGLNTGGQGVGNMVGGSATSQAQSRSTGLREPLVSTSSAKRYMLKHLEATKASDREPPPH